MRPRRNSPWVSLGFHHRRGDSLQGRLGHGIRARARYRSHTEGSHEARRTSPMRPGRGILVVALFVAPLCVACAARASVPPTERGSIDFERLGMHDAANIRTMFWNFGMVGDYPSDPLHVDLSVFHSVEVPKGSGMNYSDGITPFVLA